MNLIVDKMKDKRPRAPMCTKCRNHGLLRELRGHKMFCKYRKCTCAHCILVNNRRDVMKRQVALRRLQITLSSQFLDHQGRADSRTTIPDSYSPLLTPDQLSEKNSLSSGSHVQTEDRPTPDKLSEPPLIFYPMGKTACSIEYKRCESEDTTRRVDNFSAKIHDFCSEVSKILQRAGYGPGDPTFTHVFNLLLTGFVQGQENRQDGYTNTGMADTQDEDSSSSTNLTTNSRTRVAYTERTDRGACTSIPAAMLPDANQNNQILTQSSSGEYSYGLISLGNQSNTMSIIHEDPPPPTLSPIYKLSPVTELTKNFTKSHNNEHMSVQPNHLATNCSKSNESQPSRTGDFIFSDSCQSNLPTTSAENVLFNGGEDDSVKHTNTRYRHKLFRALANSKQTNQDSSVDIQQRYSDKPAKCVTIATTALHCPNKSYPSGKATTPENYTYPQYVYNHSSPLLSHLQANHPQLWWNSICSERFMPGSFYQNPQTTGYGLTSVANNSASEFPSSTKDSKRAKLNASSTSSEKHCHNKRPIDPTLRCPTGLRVHLTGHSTSPTHSPRTPVHLAVSVSSDDETVIDLIN